MPGPQGGPAPGGPGPSRDPAGQSKKETRFVRRAVSPGTLTDPRRITSTTGHLAAASTITGLTKPHPAVGVRVRDKFVPLPDANSKPQVVVEEEVEEVAESPAVAQKRGRITVITVAESFNRKALEAALLQVAADKGAVGAASPPANSTPAITSAPTPSVSGTTTPVTAPAVVPPANGAPVLPAAQPTAAAIAAAPAAAATAPAAAAAPAAGASSGSAAQAGAAAPGAAAASGAGAGAGGGGGAAVGVSNGGAKVTMTVTTYPEVTYVRTAHGEAMEAPGEVFFFDYGVVAFWGMTEAQEQSLLSAVVKGRGVAVQLLDEDEKQVEELLFVYSRDSQPNIRNDTFTIDSRLAADYQVKMAISHALAQSSKLSVYEERMVALVEEVRDIPAEMAEKGSISLSRRKVAQLMGKVFLLKAAVNLTATILDTPEFFWRAPDQLQVLYERACEYLDIDSRLDMLNARFQVLQRMLDIWSDHSAHQNLARLDVIIVLLILIEVVMAGMEVVGFLMRRRGWQYHGPKLWGLLWGHHTGEYGAVHQDLGMGMGPAGAGNMGGIPGLEPGGAWL